MSHLSTLLVTRTRLQPETQPRNTANLLQSARAARPLRRHLDISVPRAMLRQLTKFRATNFVEAWPIPLQWWSCPPQNDSKNAVAPHDGLLARYRRLPLRLARAMATRMSVHKAHQDNLQGALRVDLNACHGARAAFPKTNPTSRRGLAATCSKGVTRQASSERQTDGATGMGRSHSQCSRSLAHKGNTR